jgi:hypothetical protein
MVSVIFSSAIDCEFRSRGRLKPKTITLEFVASLLSIKDKGQRAVGSESG